MIDCSFISFQLLSGTGAALSTLTNLYSLQQNIKVSGTLGVFGPGSVAVVVTSACNDEI